MTIRPLSGVRVLDFGLLTAGANTSAMLADLGAEVLKIESGAYLDPFRVVGKPDNADGWWNRSPQFRFTNRNKRGLALNLKDPQGQRVIRALAAQCDVVVENFRRGVLDRAGLGYKELSAINPGIVFAAISSQGDTGPERMNVSFGSTLDATSGIAALTGYEGEEPRISGMDVNYPDQIVSLFATGMVITAIMEARRDGKGCFLDFSQREVASFTLGEEILASARDPKRIEARRGNATEGVAQQDAYRCRDGRWIAVTSESAQPDLIAFCAGRTGAEAIAELLARGLAAAPCNDGNDLLHDTALAGVTLVRDEKGLLVKGLPYRLDGQGITIERAAPDLGQHTEEVLRKLLGYDEAKLEELAKAGVTSVTPDVGDVMARAEVQKLIDRMAMPLIAAPMFLVSNPSLALACCGEGVMGSFPAHGTRSREEFQAWLDEMREGVQRLEDAGKTPAPWAVNLVVHSSNPRYPGDLELVEKYRVPVVLTSKGAPGDAIKRIHGWGAVALHDIANRRHAEKALEAGVDGVIAVAGGAGGHTGTINPFALMNEVRQLGDHFAVVLAGGMSTGRDVLAAGAMGADLAYIGTRFIATREAMAADAHKKMILDTRAIDVFLTASIDGAPANWLVPSLLAAGIDLDVLRTTLPGKIVAAQENKKRWKDIYTAGHGVGNIDDIPTSAELCRRLIQQYREAKSQMTGGRAKAAAA